MDTYSPTPSSGHGRTSRHAAKVSGGLPSMSQRQTEAYLLARDTLRRIQRASSMVSAVSQRAAGRNMWAHGDRQQSH